MAEAAAPATRAAFTSETTDPRCFRGQEHLFTCGFGDFLSLFILF